MAFDKVFYKGDPIIAIRKIRKEFFEHCLNSISIIGILSQLFLIEQEYCYSRTSNYEPATLFLSRLD